MSEQQAVAEQPTAEHLVAPASQPAAVQRDEARSGKRPVLWILGVVILAVGVGVLLAIPNLLSASINANESAAIATLKNISSGQAQCQASGVIDCNSNGQGEYGFFGELSGANAFRKDEIGGVGTALISPPVLSTAFGNVVNGTVTRSGYVFQMFLPDDKRVGRTEAPEGGGGGVPIAPGEAEVLWCCYAWPEAHGSTGKRVFFVNQSGDVLASKNITTQYGSSASATPSYDAAFDPDSAETGMGARVAANNVGKDGEVWTIVK